MIFPLIETEAETRPSNATLEEVFDLLKRKGPLCPSQISFELLLSLKEVFGALQTLREEGTVEPRDDRWRDGVEKEIAPWGLRKH